MSDFFTGRVPATTCRISLGFVAAWAILTSPVKPSNDSEATAVSLYDGTVEGFAFPDLRARSVQFHPEAGPGPHDGWPLLETWVEETVAEKK